MPFLPLLFLPPPAPGPMLIKTLMFVRVIVLLYPNWINGLLLSCTAFPTTFVFDCSYTDSGQLWLLMSVSHYLKRLNLKEPILVVFLSSVILSFLGGDDTRRKSFWWGERHLYIGNSTVLIFIKYITKVGNRLLNKVDKTSEWNTTFLPERVWWRTSIRNSSNWSDFHRLIEKRKITSEI